MMSVRETLHVDDVVLARAFIDHEADLLDRLAYPEWLALWAPNSRYILPIEREATDYECRLNHIYDDDSMREQRVERLLSGHAPSASPIMRTVRSVGRVSILASDANELLVSSSLTVVTYKRQVQTLIVAEAKHRLARGGDGLKIKEKVVLLINSDDALAEMSFLL